MPSVRHQMAVQMVRSRPRPQSMPVEAARMLMRDFSILLPMPEGARCETVRLGSLAAEWLTPPGEPLGAMLYLHGGGYCLGSIESHRCLCARIALATGCRVLLVDYRLAPEDPYPAALEDALAGYEWLLGEGYSEDRILIGGDSAGGGLTLAVLLALRDRGTVLPAGGICLSPWTDLTLAHAAPLAETTDDPMVNLRDARRLAAYYAGDADLRDPMISPMFGDAAGLPSLLIQVGTREVLLEDSRRFAAAALNRGVDVTLEEWSGLMHVWQIFAPMVPEAVQAIDAVGRWARNTLGAEPASSK